MISGITYLACPHSHPLPLIRELRYKCVNAALGSLIESREDVFSPISMTHETHLLHPNIKHERWLSMDEKFLNICERLVVLGLPGWRESKGVQIELGWWEERRKTSLGLAFWQMLSLERNVPASLLYCHSYVLSKSEGLTNTEIVSHLREYNRPNEADLIEGCSTFNMEREKDA